MVEKFLVDLFRRTQKQKIAIIIDGTIFSDVLVEKLPSLVEKLREIGDIKVAEVIYESKIPDKDYEILTQVGFTEKQVPSNLDLNILADTYDLILSDKSIDTLVFGTENENLIPLIIELRKNVTIFALTVNPISKSFGESFDDVIVAQDIDEFHFRPSDVSEMETIIGSAFEDQGIDGVGTWTTGDIEANISPMSDDLEEQIDLDQEIKKGFKDDEASEVEIEDSKELSKRKKKDLTKQKKTKKSGKQE